MWGVCSWQVRSLRSFKSSRSISRWSDLVCYWPQVWLGFSSLTLGQNYWASDPMLKMRQSLWNSLPWPCSPLFWFCCFSQGSENQEGMKYSQIGSGLYCWSLRSGSPEEYVCYIQIVISDALEPDIRMKQKFHQWYFPSNQSWMRVRRFTGSEPCCHQHASTHALPKTPSVRT